MKKWAYRFIFGLPVLKGEALTHADAVLGWPRLLVPLVILLGFCVAPFVVPLRMLHVGTDVIVWLGLYVLLLAWFLRERRVGDINERFPEAALPALKKMVQRWSCWFGGGAAVIIWLVLAVAQYREYGPTHFWANGVVDTLFNMAWQVAAIAWLLEHEWRVALQSHLISNRPLYTSESDGGK